MVETFDELINAFDNFSVFHRSTNIYVNASGRHWSINVIIRFTGHTGAE